MLYCLLQTGNSVKYHTMMEEWIGYIGLYFSIYTYLTSNIKYSSLSSLMLSLSPVKRTVSVSNYVSKITTYGGLNKI